MRCPKTEGYGKMLLESPGLFTLSLPKGIVSKMVRGRLKSSHSGMFCFSQVRESGNQKGKKAKGMPLYYEVG